MKETGYGPCACLGPSYNEEFCPCVMKQKGLERSKEYKEYYSEANCKQREEKLQKAFEPIFKENKERLNKK